MDADERHSQSHERVTSTAKKLLPWLVAIAFFMEALDATILNTAVPIIADALKVLPLNMKSVLSSYTLSLAVFIPISSWVADRFGTRRVFAWAIGLFTLGSVFCGLASNIHVLVACRILQGCGGAMMVPVGRLTLVRSFAKSDLIKTMSFVAIPALIGPMLGPLAGGLIVRFFHWRMVFFVNVPIGLAGLYLVFKYLPDFRSKKVPPLDIVGLILFGAGIALLSYVLEVFGEHSLGSAEVLGLLAISMTLLLGYWVHARSMSFPLLRLGLLRIRTLRIGVTGSFITRLGVGGLPFLLPLLYQIGLGYSPIESGLLMMPQSITAMALKMVAPRILTRFGYRSVLLLNTIMMGGLAILFAFFTQATPVWVIIFQACVFGFFSSLQYTCMNTLVYADIPDAETSMASTIVSTVQQMSMSFGVATASLLTAFFIPESLRGNSSELLHGLHEAFIFMGLLTALSSLGFIELKSTDGDVISKHSEAIH